MWEGERLRKRTEEALAALRAEAEERAGRRRRGLFGRLRAQIELDEDAATVMAMNAAGATVRQIARYTALEPSDVDRLLRGDRGGPAARAEARARKRGVGAGEPLYEAASEEDVAQAS